MLEQPLASQSQEGFNVSFTGFSVEDVDFPMNTVPTEVASSQATPLDERVERPVQDSHVSHDDLVCGCLISVMSSVYPSRQICLNTKPPRRDADKGRSILE